MKHTYKSGSLLVLAMVIVGLLYQFTGHSWKPEKEPGKLTGKAAKPDIPQSTVSQLQQGLEKREYHISYDEQKKSLQSPNRKQNLRAYYKPGKLSIQNRVDSAGHNFQFQLTTLGVYADGQILYVPEEDAKLSNHENQLDIHSGGFTEQYVNSEAGVRQNFIVDSAPENTEKLQVKLFANGLKVEDQNNNELHFYSESKAGKKEDRLIYNDLKCWDHAGKALNAALAYQNDLIVIEVDVAKASFPITIDPIISNGNPGNASVTLESNQAGANAGRSVSSAGDVNGDGYSDVLIGAPLFDKGETNEGAVFVHYGSASGISVNPALILEGNQAEAQFGGKAALAGDVNKDGYGDIIVGASYYDKGQTNEGAAFIYHGSANGLSANPAVVLESNQAEARFGLSVNLAGDVNADGFSDVVVSAVLYDKGQTNEGAAFVYHGSAAGISPSAAVTLEGNQTEARMGYTVSSAGDVNGDGYSDIIVGVYLYDKGEVDEGTALIYHGSALGVSANAATILESNQATSYFGASVSFAGDVNGDGYGDVVVGAYLYDNGQTNEGAAFVYLGSAAGLNVNSKKQLELNQSSAQFGYFVNSAGDVNGDGYADIIVGANLYDKGESDEGAAFVFHGSANGISANTASTLESNQTNAQMGWAVASAGDVNGDGYSDVVVGAHFYDKGQVDEGAAFVWMGGANDLGSLTIMKVEGNQADGNFGWTVTNSGDVNGDGYSDVLVSATAFDNGQLDEGAVFLYHGSPTGLELSPVTVIEGNESSAGMGNASFAGDVNGDGFDDIIVGVPFFGPNDAGAAFLYHGSAEGIVNVVKMKLVGNQTADEHFGNSVSSAGDVNGDGFSDLIVGIPGKDVTQEKVQNGVVQIYHGSANGISVQPFTIIKGGGIGFGFQSATTAGDINGDGFGDIVVGDPFYSNVEKYEGAISVYYGSPTGIQTSTSSTLQSDKSQARLGSVVTCAGDINGDGYFDLVAGAPTYTSGQQYEGAVYIYYGSQTGINSGPSIIESNNILAQFGSAISQAGDIDSDGYDDLVVGASNWSEGENSEGAFFIFSGSVIGLNPNYGYKFESNQTEANLGISVGGGGDVNGDGFSDIISGCYQFKNQTDIKVGYIAITYGGSFSALKNNLRLYNSDLATPINHSQFPQNIFGAGLYTKSFLGGNKGKLVWETKPKGQGFSKGADNVITHSTQSSGSQNVYTSLGLGGTELKNVIAKQGAATKVRARVKFDPVLALNGQTYGPWRYLSSYPSGGGVAPVPEEKTSAMTETVGAKTLMNDQVMVYPNPVSDKLVVKVGESSPVAKLQLYSILGKSLRSSQNGETEMNVGDLDAGNYILVVSHKNGTQSSHKVLIKR